MLVIDASVAVKFVTEEPGSDLAYQIVVGPDSLIAPDWVLAECANAIAKKVLNAGLSRARGEASVMNLPRFFARLFATDALIEKALHLSFDLSHAFYDCVYLALAVREGAVLVTADAEFIKSARDAGFNQHICLLGEENER